MTEHEQLKKRVEHLECTIVGLFYILDQVLPPEIAHDAQLMCGAMIMANEKYGADIDTKLFYQKYEHDRERRN